MNAYHIPDGNGLLGSVPYFKLLATNMQAFQRSKI